jgi:hypothetical protein
MNPARFIPNFALLLLAAGASSLCLAQSAPMPAPPNGNIPPAATAPAPAPVPVEVKSHGNQIEVKVPDQAPLSTVMSSLCQQQKLKCTGTETLASYHGPAMSVEGTLRQVISKLVEGTDINYEFSRSAEGGATAIAFLGHAPKGTAPVPNAEAPAAPPPPRPIHSRPFPGRLPPPGTGPAPDTPPAPQPQAPQPQAELEPEAQHAAVDPEQQRQSEEAAKILFTGSGNPDTGVLPFPDAQGNPIPKTDSAPTVLPFPDQHGNPIPVKPSQGGSPFPVKPSPPGDGGSKQ